MAVEMVRNCLPELEATQIIAAIWEVFTELDAPRVTTLIRTDFSDLEAG
jgi:hypothetical protein